MEVTFDKLWKDIEERSQRWSIPIVQDRAELEHVFNLMKGCKSYLEVGTAEGNSLYVLSHALPDKAKVFSIDFGEKHTRLPCQEITSKLRERLDFNSHTCNSHAHYAPPSALERWGIDKTPIFIWELEKPYDVVLIDAGHTYEDVIADAAAFGWMANKYIIFHDIQIPEVRKAFDWYCAQNPQFKRSEFINSTTYGYGILEV